MLTLRKTAGETCAEFTCPELYHNVNGDTICYGEEICDEYTCCQGECEGETAIKGAREGRH